MDCVSASDVGPVSLNRMLREGILVPVGPRHGAPLDLPVTRIDRACPLDDIIPSHTVLSGLAGLWVHSGGNMPRTLDLVGARGLHRAPPGTYPAGWILRFHSGAAALEPAETISGIRIASPSRCVADALRWEDLSGALPVVLTVLKEGIVARSEVADVIDGESPRGRGTARLTSVWAAIEKALDPV